MTSCSRFRLSAVAYAFVFSAVAAFPASATLSLKCSELSQTFWFSEDAQKVHAQIYAGAALGLLNAKSHSIIVDEAKHSILLDVFEPGGQNNPAWGEIKVLTSTDYINITNVIPANHGGSVNRLTIGIDRVTGVYLWQEETLDANDRVGVTAVHAGVCSAARAKF